MIIILEKKKQMKMKTKTNVCEITHDDLVNLLSTALYGSYWLRCLYNKTEYINSSPDEGDCCEDKLAKILLHGYSITLCDCYAEDKDDSYGNLPNVWDSEFSCMCYTITLKDIQHGLELAFDNGGYSAKCARNLCDEDDVEFDNTQAELLIQYILFGEEIYG